jgi:hypothetical protein
MAQEQAKEEPKGLFTSIFDGVKNAGSAVVDGVKTVGGAVADGAKVCRTLSQPQALLHSRLCQSGVGAVGSGLGAVVDAGKVIALYLSLANCCAHCSCAERCQFRR